MLPPDTAERLSGAIAPNISIAAVGFATRLTPDLTFSIYGPMSWIYLGALALVTAALRMVSTVGAAAIYFELREIKEGVGATELASVFD